MMQKSIEEETTIHELLETELRNKIDLLETALRGVAGTLTTPFSPEAFKSEKNDPVLYANYLVSQITLSLAIIHQAYPHQNPEEFENRLNTIWHSIGCRGSILDVAKAYIKVMKAL